MRRDSTLRRWTVVQEFSIDDRTGVVVNVFRSGPAWVWRVSRAMSLIVQGERSSRKSARAAARAYVRKIAESKPDRQLDLFK